MIKRFIIKATNELHEVIVLYAGTVLVAALIYAASEGRSFADALWWAIVTSTTTGYGDISPETLVGRIVGCILMLLSVFFIAPLIVAHILAAVKEDG